MGPIAEESEFPALHGHFIQHLLLALGAFLPRPHPSRDSLCIAAIWADSFGHGFPSAWPIARTRLWLSLRVAVPPGGVAQAALWSPVLHRALNPYPQATCSPKRRVLVGKVGGATPRSLQDRGPRRRPPIAQSVPPIVYRCPVLIPGRWPETRTSTCEPRAGESSRFRQP